MTVGINYNGNFKSTTKIFINYSDSLKQVVKGFINVGGTLKQFFTSAPPVSPPSNTVAPVVSRNATDNYIYSTTNGGWTGSPTGYTYQWYYYKYVPYPPYNAGGIITGATSSSYTSSATYVGYDIYCVVTASNSGGSTDAISNSVTITTATTPFVNPGTPTSPVNSYFGSDAFGYYYTCSWTAPTTGTTPFEYFVQVYGGTGKTAGTPGSGGTYVNVFGPFSSTSGNYSSSYPWNYFNVYARNYDGSSYHLSSSSTNSTWE